jgi:hypothetical protein
MKYIQLVLVILLLLAGAAKTSAQSNIDSSDPREMALDVYTSINRGVEPATVALKLSQIIELFRYRCTRVTDYQVFTQRPNLTDLKVKCSGDPLYGVTVASNGFVSVYGGNQILSALDRRDGVILSFGAEGDLSGTSAVDIERVTEETKARFMLGGEYDYLYLVFILGILLVMVGGISLVFIKLWRRRKLKRKPRSRMKPMKKYRQGLTSDLKNRLVADSKKISKYVHQHESGVVIAVGKRGKRRLFLSPFWGKMYAQFGLNMFEASEAQLANIDFSGLVDVEEVAEGEEVTMPRD